MGAKMTRSPGGTISRNEASEGGALGVAAYSKDVSIANLALDANLATSGLGSAVHVSLGSETVVVANCSSSNHFSKSRGAALYVASTAWHKGDLHCVETLVSDGGVSPS